MDKAILRKRNCDEPKEVTLEEARATIEDAAPMFNLSPDELWEQFKSCGYNVFSAEWRQYVRDVNEGLKGGERHERAI